MAAFGDTRAGLVGPDEVGGILRWRYTTDQVAQLPHPHLHLDVEERRDPLGVVVGRRRPPGVGYEAEEGIEQPAALGGGEGFPLGNSTQQDGVEVGPGSDGATQGFEQLAQEVVAFQATSDLVGVGVAGVVAEPELGLAPHPGALLGVALRVEVGHVAALGEAVEVAGPAQGLVGVEAVFGDNGVFEDLFAEDFAGRRRRGSRRVPLRLLSGRVGCG